MRNVIRPKNLSGPELLILALIAVPNGRFRRPTHWWAGSPRHMPELFFAVLMNRFQASTNSSFKDLSFIYIIHLLVAGRNKNKLIKCPISFIIIKISVQKAFYMTVIPTLALAGSMLLLAITPAPGAFATGSVLAAKT